ncbi:HAD-IIB family hydrolase [Streptomyces prasinopilosus]|uniref:Kanosamine-6-phosphate phosphatase n=1 Tax=Streptomyces prasinopilosus TaxID=67344 RepID=A0A1G6M3K3_9ACTN|nr:HAD-IIB family hydrolase [Streptomyces prasinopilosus]SDC49536.1 kanosamine-6-phosphate phosphatase [Streptomyces prasinopilosus]
MTASVPASRLSPLPPPRPRGVPLAVFCDFDETYLAHDPSPRQRRDLVELEDLLLEEATRGTLLFGWVTGSSLESVLAKADRHRLRVLPHFLAASLGTDLTYFTTDGPHRDERWRHRLRASGYTKATVNEVVAQLVANGVSLRPQGGQERAEFLSSYYYTAREDRSDRAAIRRIETACVLAGLSVSTNRCNPKAGDPDGSYDVDFLPRTGGKRAVVAYLVERFTAADSLAFGDSGNDLDMLRGVRHGYLVANATAEARAAHPRVSPHPYAAAVRHAIEQARGRAREETETRCV